MLRPNLRNVTASLSALLMAGCASLGNQPPSKGHLTAESVPQVDAADIPVPVQSALNLPRPKAAPKTETYSVVVNNVKAQDLLFALARDAKLNIDIHPGINGAVTLNAIDQTLQQLLTRIAKQVDIRWELDGPNLIVMPDTPFLRTYRVDYVNMTRDVTVTMSVNSQVSSSGTGGASGGTGGTSGATGGGASNNAITKIENASKNRFWDTLERNVKDILRETDKILPEGSSETVVERSDQQVSTGTQTSVSRSGTVTQTNNGGNGQSSQQQEGTTVVRRATFKEAASVIVNPENGIITVRATSRQHEKVQEFLDNISSSAHRQVMIEATIVQVDLSDGYQQGINWSRLRADGSRFGLALPTLSSAPSSITPFRLTNLDNSTPLNLDLTLQLLKSFGTVKVMSSPKLSVLNNQTAVLKVVENFVYFSVKSDVATGNTGAAQKAITTTPQTVSIGLVMSVTPQISANGSIILNVRPSISSISTTVLDPNPDLTIENKVPVIQTREIESILRVQDGEIAVLGGLMQERADYKTGKVPGVGEIPILGELFTNRNNSTSKSELVIFLRPVIVRDPSVNGDYQSLKGFLPTKDFNNRPDHAEILPTVRGDTQ